MASLWRRLNQARISALSRPSSATIIALDRLLSTCDFTVEMRKFKVPFVTEKRHLLRLGGLLGAHTPPPWHHVHWPPALALDVPRSSWGALWGSGRGPGLDPVLGVRPRPW